MTATHDDYEAFVADAWPRLFRTAYALTGRYHEAEDALQTALTKAYASWARVTKATTPDAYVRRMLINEVISGARSRRRRSRIESKPDVHRAGPGHEHVIAETMAMWDAIRTLPPRQRAILVLRYYDDLSEQQIADALGVATGTVKSQASAALSNLQRALESASADPAGGKR